MSHKIYIKNMVCNRCIMAVETVMQQLNVEPFSVAMGEVRLKEKLPDSQLVLLDSQLKTLGFERIDDKRARLIEKIKAAVIHKVHHSDSINLTINWSDLLAEEAGMEYHYLSSLFSSVEGVTLEQYIIRQKIERAKELLFYDELSLSQIADKLGYSSVAHLSAQFKKVTGTTPSFYKQMRSEINNRYPIDSLS